MEQLLVHILNILKDKKIKCKVLMIEQNSSNNSAFILLSINLISTLIELHNGFPFLEKQIQMLRCHAGLIVYDRDLGIDSLPNRFFEYFLLLYI